MLPIIAMVTGVLPGLDALRAWAAPTHYPVAVVLCNTPDQIGVQELPTAYYHAMFTAGNGGAADWFQQVSRGTADLGGTQVLGPYTVQNAGPAYPPGTTMTLQRANGLRRYDRIQACAGAAADAGVNLSAYQEIIAVYVAHEKDPAFTPPNAVTTLSSSATATDTTLQVASAAGFPTPPFPILVGTGDPQNGGALKELIEVTGESGVGNTTWTVARGFEEGGPGGLNNCAQGGPSPTNGVALAAGLQVEVPYSADGGACLVGRVSSFTVGTLHPQALSKVGLVAMDPLMSLAVLPHEMSHALLGLVHSSDLLVQSDYQDAWDMMSAQATYRSTNQPSFVKSFNYEANPEGYGWVEGPGFNSVNLDNLGWLSPSQEDTTLLSASSCTTRAVTLDPLSIQTVSPGHYLDVQLPFTSQAGFPSGQHYTVEFRSPVQGNNYTVWDQGVPETVLVHLAGKGSPFPSYLVDTNVGGALNIQGAQAGGFSGGTPQFVAGSTFVDPTSHAYLAVNRIDTSNHTAQVTVGNCTLPTSLSYVGDTTGDFNDTAMLAADLTTNPGSGPGGPVANQPVTLAVGSQSCLANTDANGHAACAVTLKQAPANTTVSASFAGTTTYSAANTNAPFTIRPEDSRLTYVGNTSADYHDPATLSAVLSDPSDGTPIPNETLGFTLGSQSCTPLPTDGSGFASCVIVPQQPAGTVSVVGSFKSDPNYQAATISHPFSITKEETTTIYTGPTVIAQKQSVTLSGKLLEDGTTPISGRSLTLSVGAQSCTTGLTDSSGFASCSISSVSVPQGPEPLKATFGGDPFYLPSSDTSHQAIVFAFPSRGDFALGDSTAAGLTGTVTWWGARWALLNDLSGGPAPASFKGFTETPNPSPTVCGGTWTSSPGNSSKPVDAVPSYMGVVISSHVSSSGGTISGDVTKIVVVKTDSGYAPDPGKPGTGTIVATYC